MTFKTTWIGFKLNISEVNKIVKFLLENPAVKISQKSISESINLRQQMVDSYIFWARYLGIIKKSGYELTEFGTLYKEIWSLEKDTIYEILYYKTIVNNSFLNILINDIIFERFLSYPRIIEYNEIEQRLSNYMKEIHIKSFSELKKRKTLYINSLTDEEGFGELNILEKSNKKLKIKKHLPTWKGAYYILVMNQIVQNNRNRIISVDSFLEMRNQIRRIFMLNEDDVYFILDELISKHLIKREKASHFDQIYIIDPIYCEKELIEVILEK